MQLQVSAYEGMFYIRVASEGEHRGVDGGRGMTAGLRFALFFRLICGSRHKEPVQVLSQVSNY